MRRLRIATTLPEIERLRPLWEELESAPGTTLFQRYCWNVAAVRHLGERPVVVALESDSGAAILPAAQTASGLSFLGEMLFDYRDALALGDETVLDEALGELAPHGDELWLPAVRADARLAGRVGMLEPWVGAPYVRSASISPAAFLQQHFKARRQLHRLQKAGACFGRYDGSAQALLELVYRRKAEQYAGSELDIFSDRRRRGCMLEICARSGPSCDVFTLEAGGSPVAVLVSFREAAARRLYTMWYDPAWAHFSPGTTLMLHAIHVSLEEGLDVDLLTGEGPHKVRFTNARMQLYRLRASAAELQHGAAVSTAA